MCFQTALDMHKETRKILNKYCRYAATSVKYELLGLMHAVRGKHGVRSLK